MSRSRRREREPLPALLQILAALAGGAVLFLALALVAANGFDLYHAGRVYPGVFMAGIPLEGLTPEQANAKLAQELTYPKTGKIVFQDGANIWSYSPADLGLNLDAQANAQAAYLLGRSGNPAARFFSKMQAWFFGVDLAPAMIYNERKAQEVVLQLAAQINQPTREASLSVEGSEVVAVPGQVGRVVDVPATLARLQEPIRALTDGLVPLVIQERPPEILDASQQAEAARRMISQPLTLSLPDAKPGDPGPYVLPPQQLAKMLIIERTTSGGAAQYQVALSDQALNDYLTALAGDIDRQPANARFMFNDETGLLEVIQPAVIGRSLDVQASIQEIKKKIAEGNPNVALSVTTLQPEVADNATGEQLGITELVVAYTSYFRGSSTERLQNIEKAAANFHGLLIPPGATFSMASAMGNVSLDSGYAEAWIIFGGRTIKGVGGGVCQVSTTLFRTAFLAGFPIVERHPHAYRVGYYEQTAADHDPDWAGLDATVFVPMVDFKFTNDTPYWLLMETYFRPNTRSLTWKFYSTKDGRTVEWETSGPQNVVEPPDPVFEENPELAKGQVEQVDWEAEGADVTVTRTVYKDGQVWLSDSFITHYLPWAAVYQYGPGTNLTKLMKKKLLNP
jgi:vancomycin resistance protein YoaR